MATITNRGPLQWRARIRRKGYPVTTKTFETKSEAEAWARELESEMDKGIFVSRTEAESYTLTECLDRFVEEYIPRLKHPEYEIKRIRKLQKHPLACRIMASIRSKDIAAFRKDLELEGAKPNTIRLYFAILSRLFNYARSDWGMESLQNLLLSLSLEKDVKGVLKMEKKKNYLKMPLLNCVL